MTKRTQILQTQKKTFYQFTKELKKNSYLKNGKQEPQTYRLPQDYPETKQDVA